MSLITKFKSLIAKSLTVFGNVSATGTITSSNLSGTNTGDQDLSGLVPYTGATSNVDLGAYSLSAASVSISGNMDVDGNTLFVDSANNRVGIGTNSPTRPLHVNGTSQFSGNIYNNSSDPSLTLRSTTTNAANAGSIFFQTASATESVSIVFNASTNVWMFTYGGNNLNLTATGVGIGTASPSEKLTVVGNISASGTITGSNLVYTSGDQTIEGDKTFTDDVAVNGQLTAPNQTATTDSDVITRGLGDARYLRHWSAVLSSDESGPENSITLQDSLTLSFNLDAGTYDIESLILTHCNSLAAGSRQKLNWTGTASIFEGFLYQVNNGAVTSNTWPNTRQAGVAVDALRQSINESIATNRIGRLVATSNGTLSVQFSSGQAAVGISARLAAGSYLKVTKIS